MKITNYKYGLTYTTLAFLIVINIQPAYAEDEFDSSLWGGGSVLDVDFSRFNQKNAVLPGEYQSDVWVNGVLKGNETLRFADNEDTHVAELCLTRSLQDALDLKTTAIVREGDNDQCVFIKQAIPQGIFTYQQGELKLNVDIPQALTMHRPRDYVSPSRWQSSTSAMFVNYDMNYYRYNASHHYSENLYTGIKAGVNLGNWAFRHNGAWVWNKTKSDYHSNYETFSNYQRGETYLQRDFEWLRGNITLGDFYTAGQIGESLGMRGIKIASDDRMLAPSQRGFAPVIKSIARSNANVTIKQNGNIIYQTAVPAGAFEISDLYPSGYNGDLLVEIQESDGSIRSFIVPYSNVAPLIRVGQFRYQLSGGRYQDWDNHSNDKVLQGVLQYGLFNSLTLNTGLTYSKNYHAALLGMGLNTPIGAFSFDSTWANAHFTAAQRSAEGYSLHGTYSINFNSTGTNVMLAAYRYSSRNFYSLHDTFAFNKKNYRDEFDFSMDYRPKNQYQFTINQTLGNWGELYLSGQTYNYWGKSGTASEYQVTYANNYKRLNYQIGLSQTIDNETHKRDNGIYVNLSLPFGNDNHTINSTYSHSNNNSNWQTGVSGSFGEQYQWNYGLTASKNNGNYRSLAGNMGYQSGFGVYRASLSKDNQHHRQFGFGASGSVVAHQHGITLGQQVGDSFAIIHAKDASGALIDAGGNKRIDYFGNGIVPYTTPYAVNYISINPQDIDQNVEFAATEKQIIPRANGINLVNFDTHKNTMILFNLTQSDGETVPMAAVAKDEKGKFIGYVVQGGMLFAGQLTHDKGKLFVQWGDNQNEQCQFDYAVDLSNTDSNEAKIYEAMCH